MKMAERFFYERENISCPELPIQLTNDKMPDIHEK
jgi:hypothetical protein